MLKFRMGIVLLFGILAMAALSSGCWMMVPVAAGGAGVSGTYVYINGEMTTDYNASIDKVWAAAEKTIADMQGTDVEPVREIAQGTINVVINDEKVLIKIRYKEKNLTTVAIRVGLFGNKLSSKMLHDKLSENLAKKK
ncbi:MAG: DUF3568 family protein [Syntrophales bacterium]|nr:DUF3568 family protein [Syntrophales bacterium]MDD5233342.1 DUF3568 family protein [Syntrophales bacterium]MDD5531558.1 DUF3568 family protein [Syntrophales bacterium]HPL63290.1 DUF3568 family protein [Syntrophales bacterium]